MEPINFLKSLYITFTLILIFLSSIPTTETWKPDRNLNSQRSLGSKSNQNTELEVFKAPRKRHSEDNPQKSQRRLALSLEVSNDITQHTLSNYVEIDDPKLEYHPPINEGLNTGGVTAENDIPSKEIDQKSQTSEPQIIKKVNISSPEDINPERSSPDSVMKSTPNEEATQLPLIDEMDKILGSQNRIFENEYGRDEGMEMYKHEYDTDGEFYIQDQIEEDREPCRNNHDDHFKSSASRLYTKGPKLAYAYNIAGLWLSAFMMKIINSIRKN